MTAAYQLRAPEDVQRIAELEEENVYLRRQLALEVDRASVENLRQRYGLSPHEAIILATLIEAADRPVSKGLLVDLLPKRGGERDSDQIVAVYISKLRRKLGHDAIQTLWGSGFKIGAAFLAGLPA